MVNEIEFVVENGVDEELGLQYKMLDFIIDEKPLRSIIKEVEYPMAEAEGNPQLAGRYAPMTAMPDLKNHFLGKYKFYVGSENKTVLFGCTCGVTACWPLLCEIVIENNIICWKNFEQPWRLLDSHTSVWDYSHFEGFKFEKDQYLNALSDADKERLS